MSRLYRSLFLWLVCVMSSLAFTTNSVAADFQHSQKLDDLTQRTLDAMVSGQWSQARITAQQLSAAFPDYALGQYLLAETHRTAAQSAPLLSTEKYSAELLALLLEARSRVIATETTTKEPTLPAELVQIGTHIDNVIYVDLATSALYLYDTTNNQPKLIKKKAIYDRRLVYIVY